MKDKNEKKNQPPVEQPKSKDKKTSGKGDGKDKLAQSDLNKAEGLDREKDDNRLDGFGPLLTPKVTELKKKAGGKEEPSKEEAPGDKEVAEVEGGAEVLVEGEVPVEEVKGGGGLEKVESKLETVGKLPQPLQLTAGLPPVAKLPSLQIKAAATKEEAATTGLVTDIAKDIDGGRHDLKAHILGLHSGLKTTAIDQRSRLNLAVIEQSTAIEKAAIDAGAAVATAFVKQGSAAKVVIGSAKIKADAELDAKLKPQMDTLIGYKARIDALSTNLAANIGAKFDDLEAQLKLTAKQAIATARQTGKSKQEALQVATVDKAKNDYDKRKNKAAGDAAIIAAQDAEAAIEKSLEEALASIPEQRAKYLAAAEKSLKLRQEHVNSEILRLETAATEAKSTLAQGMSGLEAAYKAQCDTMTDNAKGQLIVEAEALIEELKKVTTAHQEALDLSLLTAGEQLQEAADWSDSQFTGLSERFDEWTGLVGDVDQASLKSFQTDLAAAQASTQELFSEHVAIVDASIIRETDNGITMAREKGASGAGALTHYGKNMAAGIPQLTESLAATVQQITASAMTPLDAILTEAAPSIQALGTDLTTLEGATDVVAGLTKQRAEEFEKGANEVVTTKLATETKALIKQAHGQVIKSPGGWTWARVLTAVVSVVGSAFAIAGLVAWGIPAASTILLAGAAFTAIGQIKIAVQAKMAGEKLTIGKRAKEALISFTTGTLAAMGGMLMAAVPIRGVLSIVELTPVFAAIKAFVVWATESLGAKIAARAVIGMLPRKIDTLIQWVRSKSPKRKKKLAEQQLMLEEEEAALSAEERLERSIERDNIDAIKNPKAYRGGTATAAAGHIVKGLIGG
ncbi:MAG: hypothetical protein KC502_21425 [Myxococcales bacterium]|nr:hypothetical protein [Myxococcales bacterium]